MRCTTPRFFIVTVVSVHRLSSLHTDDALVMRTTTSLYRPTYFPRRLERAMGSLSSLTARWADLPFKEGSAERQVCLMFIKRVCLSSARAYPCACMLSVCADWACPFIKSMCVGQTSCIDRVCVFIEFACVSVCRFQAFASIKCVFFNSGCVGIVACLDPTCIVI